MDDKRVFELDDNLVLNKIKTHKRVAAIASMTVVSLIAGALILTAASDNTKVLKTASGNSSVEKTQAEVEKTTTSTTSAATTIAEPEVTIPEPKATTPIQSTPKATTPPAPVIPARPGNPSNLRFDGFEVIGGEIDEIDTYNVYFSWNASPNANVKYCVTTNAEGAAHDNSCTWNKPYINSQTSRGFGLVFKKNTPYQFKVTAVDQYNQKSDTISLTWQLP